MNSFVKKAGLSLVLGATVLTAAAPAEAQRYRGRYYRHHDNTGAAVAAGIAGLAIGAALAGSGRRDYDRRYYYDDRYDGYYRNNYYYRDSYYNYPRYRERCGVRRVWDPYLGRSVRVRYCR